MTKLEAMKQISLCHFKEVPAGFIAFIEMILSNDDIYAERGLEKRLIYLGADVEEDNFSCNLDSINEKWGDIRLLSCPHWDFHKFYITKNDEGWDELIEFFRMMVASYNL